MNPLLAKLQPYPFERVRALIGGAPDPSRTIDLSIGEPKHPTPQFIKDALFGSLDGLATYPRSIGLPELRGAISTWLARRYGIPAPDPETQILPVNGSREALFAFAQAVIDPTKNAKVVSPNPFYQIYEGAALLAGATPVYAEDLLALKDWSGVQLVYLCSPGNPTGKIYSLDEWKRLFELQDRHGFVVASDECYSELYYAEPSIGGLQAARRLGRDYRKLVVFSSLSKRSNVPGMRSGFVAGDAELLKAFLLYRTYHGSAMSVSVQKASIAAWSDEKHVEENRRLYAAKYQAVLPLIQAPLQADMPDGGFYLWMGTPIDDREFCKRLYDEKRVLVLPGSFLARESQGRNPGQKRVRVALVPASETCVEAARRMMELAKCL
ncbi:MAG: succinyldiaminopimelate transaminase [Betaproteobacteria bacterium]|nr:succinyldiaminopimelate transaminase [Betaproteobacteria bacterium]